MDRVASCEHVSRAFGERRVLDDVSLEIARGETIVVLGESGCGKSTLLSILGALDRGYEGTVSLFGRDLSTLDDAAAARMRAESIGFVFQGFQLLAHLSALDNVAAPALFSRHATDARARARELLEEVGLADRAHDLPASLSGGQRQRVALARAMFARPALLLCDEPTGNLDRETGEHVVDRVSKLHAEGSTAIVVATHDARFVEGATRVLRLADGALTDETRASPRSSSVARVGGAR